MSKEKTNILGEIVTPKPLTLSYEAPHLYLFRDKSAIGMIVPNGWTGKSSVINFELNEPIICIFRNEYISIAEMKTVIETWESNHK